MVAVGLQLGRRSGAVVALVGAPTNWLTVCLTLLQSMVAAVSGSGGIGNRKSVSA